MVSFIVNLGVSMTHANFKLIGALLSLALWILKSVFCKKKFPWLLPKCLILDEERNPCFQPDFLHLVKNTKILFF